jgi:hypothetical protein
MLDFTETDGLFENFEVNNEPFWPRVSWLIAGSGVWHLVVVALIILIPPVRDALSIAALFQGAGFVDRAYKKTQIGDDADIIEFTTEKFHYPEGYFAMDQQAMPTPQFPAPAPFTPQVFSPSKPTPTPTPVASPSPAIAADTGTDNKPPDSKATPSASPNNAEDKKVAEKAQQQLESASKATGIELAKEGDVNKLPFKDLAAYATELKNQGKLDFDKPFEVTIDTELDKDGKLVHPTVSKKVGDPTLVDLGGRLVAAMNDSGILFYLKKINEDKPGTKVTFTIKQNGNEVVATVESEVSSAESARQLAAAFRLMLGLGADSRKGKDEEVLLKSTTVSADSNKVVFKLTMAHQDVVDLVKKGMAEPSPTPS